MQFRLRNVAGIAAAICLGSSLLVAGCGRSSPYVGVWTGHAKMSANTPGLMALPLAMMGDVTGKLTLNPDGKGFFKLSMAPEQLITWSEEEGTLVIHSEGGNASSDKGGAGSVSASKPGNLVGHLSSDGQTLSVDLGPMSLDMHREKD